MNHERDILFSFTALLSDGQIILGEQILPNFDTEQIPYYKLYVVSDCSLGDSATLQVNHVVKSPP